MERDEWTFIGDRFEIPKEEAMEGLKVRAVVVAQRGRD